MTANNKEVVIVGGGPGGSFTALHLAALRPELAERIVLVEAKPQGRAKLCAGGVSGRVLKGAARDLGINLAALPGKDTEGLVIKFGERTAVSDRHQLARVIRRELLDSHLLDCVRERGVTVVTGTPVTNVTRVPGGICAHTGNGNYTGRVMVGADGMHGVPKKTLGICSGNHKEYLYMVDVPGFEVDSMLMLDFSPTLAGVPGYMWVFPEEGGANAGITGGAPGNMAHVKEEFQRLLEKNIGQRLDESKVKFKVYPERCFSFSTPSYTERVVYVGDKLGVAPITGEGIGICLSSGKAAAHEILRALDTGDYSFKRYPRRLLQADFVPTWSMERLLYRFKRPGLFHLFMLFVTEENRPRGENFMDAFCEVFSGDISSWSPAAWWQLRKLLPSRRLMSEELKKKSDKLPWR